MNKTKKLCAVLLLAVAGTAALPAQKFSWGIVGGMNFTKLHFSGSAKNSAGKNLSSENKAGWYIGPKVMFNTVIGLGVDAALEYSDRRLAVNNEIEHYRTLEIPVNVRYNFGLGSKAGAYVSTGPQFGFALQNMSWSNFGTGTNFDSNNLNTTWNVGAGLRLFGHLEVGVGYNFALGRIGKALVNKGNSSDAELKYKANTAQVQLTYIF